MQEAIQTSLTAICLDSQMTLELLMSISMVVTVSVRTQCSTIGKAQSDIIKIPRRHTAVLLISTLLMQLDIQMSTRIGSTATKHTLKTIRTS